MKRGIAVLLVLVAICMLAGCGKSTTPAPVKIVEGHLILTPEQVLNELNGYGTIGLTKTPNGKAIEFAVRSDAKGNMHVEALGSVMFDAIRVLGTKFQTELSVGKDETGRSYVRMTCTAPPAPKPITKATATPAEKPIEKMSAKEAIAYFNLRMSYYEEQARKASSYVGYGNLGDGVIPALQRAVDLGGDPAVINLCLDRLEKYVNHADSHDRVVDTISHVAIKKMRSQMAKRANKK